MSVKANRLLIVLMISLIVIAAVILTNFFSFNKIEDIIIGQLRENQLIKTEHAAAQIESHIRQVKDELTTLTRFPIMDTLDVSKCSGDMKVIHETVEGKIDSLLRVDKDGNILECSAPQFSSYVGLNVKNKDYFRVPKETNTPYISGMVRQGANRQIIISAPLFETTKYTPYPNYEGDFKGILMSVIEVDKLYNLYIHPILDKEKTFFLLINIDTEETILKSEGIDDFSDIKDSLPETADGLNTISDFNGLGTTIMTSSDLVLGSETWRLMMLTPLENVGDEISSVQRRHLFSLGFVIIVIITIFFFLISLYKSKEDVQSKLDKTKVTLERLGIKIETETDKFSSADVVLDKKKVYLVKEDDENHAHELFISTLNRGFAGFGVVREDPRSIKKRYNLRKTSFIWLTNTSIEGVPCETNIDNIYRLIAEFVKKSRKSVILIDRLDYILAENRSDAVIKKIHALQDLAIAHECIMILSVNPELVKERDLKAIEVESVDLFGKHLRKSVDLSDMEIEMLKFINEHNIINKLVSYKDITDKFRITKPTTRVKIKGLQGKGLLQIEQKGRFKSLKITSVGRKIIS